MITQQKHLACVDWLFEFNNRIYCAEKSERKTITLPWGADIQIDILVHTLKFVE